MEDGRADSSTSSSLVLLNKCPSEDVPKLMNSIVDALCGRKTSISHEDFNGVWPSKDEWWRVTAACREIIQRAVKSGSWTMDQLTKIVGDDVSIEYRRMFYDCLEIRGEEIRHRLLEDTCAVGGPILKDFDWQLKLVLGSDKIANVREPLASVSLDVQAENDRKRRILLEMNKEELSTLIASLESARKVVNQLQT